MQANTKTSHRVAVIGLGDMGSGLAKNLINNGFATKGYDLSETRMQAFTQMGGQAVISVAEAGANADAVFVMVMNGDQAQDIILGDNGLRSVMAPGAAILLTATIKPSEARELAAGLEASSVHLVDTPVSGGFAGAQNGALTLMAAAETEVLQSLDPVLRAVSKTIHHVGSKAGDGQTVKACLQALIGPIFTATFEAATLAAKAGVPGEVIHKVFSTSSAGCPAVSAALENIIARKFENTGSGIGTMHKDLTISLDTAQQLQVPLFTAASAMQLFHAGKSKYPEGDNWVITRLLEEIVGAELHR